jgi:hypothetical protein
MGLTSIPRRVIRPAESQQTTRAKAQSTPKSTKRIAAITDVERERSFGVGLGREQSSGAESGGDLAPASAEGGEEERRSAARCAAAMSGVGLVSSPWPRSQVWATAGIGRDWDGKEGTELM